MKKYTTSFLILLFLQISISCYSKTITQQTESKHNIPSRTENSQHLLDTITLHSSATKHSIIDTLSKPTYLLDRLSQYDILESLSKEKVEYVSIDPDSLVFFGNHPFLAGSFKAYQEHRPIIISPDIIWTLIEQGFARHVTINAERFRNRLVNFQGKQEITIIVQKNDIQLGNPNSKWSTTIPQFAEQIEKFTGKEYSSNLRADFSTTTANSRLASEIILMESVKSYFDYRMIMIGCGISSIILEGTISDWENILKKLDYIETFDLAFWTTELRPIIQQIIQSKKGNVDKTFWMNMVQLQKKQIYSPHEAIDGWIVKFYPFTDKGEKRELSTIGNIKNIAAEYVKVPFIIEDKEENKQYPMEIWAGLFGMEQDQRNHSLKPAIGWSIVHRNPSESTNFPQKDSYDIVSFKNIKELPASFYTLKNISNLELSFIGKVNISDKIKNTKIQKLTINGDINQEEKEKLKKLLPNTRIYINGAGL